MVSNRNKHYWLGFCRSLFWVWNYWILHLWTSTTQMDKGLEHVLAQFTDHCRNLVLKSSWKAQEVVQNYIQEGQVQSTIQFTFPTTGWEPSSKAGILRSGAEDSSLCRGWAVLHCCSKLDWPPRAQVWKMHSSPFALPHHNVKPKKGKKSHQNH